MTPDKALNAIWASLSLIGLIYLIFWLTRDLAVDWFRDQMFQLRDEFFDEAARGLIDFNHPAYGTLRTMMNGFIRFCHKMSLLHMLLLTYILPMPKDSSNEGLFIRNWKNATKNLDTNTLRKLEDFRNKMQLLIIVYIIVSSPFIAIALFVFLLLGFAVNSFGRFLFSAVTRLASGFKNSGRLQEYLKDIDDIAYATGEL